MIGCYHNSQGLQEWEISYEFHIGEGLVRGVDWDRTPSNGELNCDVCDRKFGWRYEVMFHNLCHKTDEDGNAKNRVCPECETAFKVPIGLKHHLLLHTGELPFLCLHCWRSFSSHIDLKLHIRKEHLPHLLPPEPEKPAKKPQKNKSDTPTTRTPRAKKIKPEETEDPEATAASTSQQVQEVTVLQQDGTENVQLVVADSGNSGENQTILVNSDGTIVQTGDQDMIVVIQSEDFDQNQGLIVVDPSQLQQVVGADGMPVTVMQANETMVLGDAGKLVVSQADQTSAAVVTTQQTEQQPITTTVTMSSDGKLVLTQPSNEQNADDANMIVPDASDENTTEMNDVAADTNDIANAPENDAAAAVTNGVEEKKSHEECKTGIVAKVVTPNANNEEEPKQATEK